MINQHFKSFKTGHSINMGARLLLLRIDKTIIRTSSYVKYVLFNPEMPYLHLPVDDFRAFTKPIKAKFGGDIQCNDNHRCYFSKNWDFIDKKDFNIYVHLTTPKTDFVDLPFKISGKNLYLKGT